MCMSSSTLFAVKKAIVAAKAEINNKDFTPLGELVVNVMVFCCKYELLFF